MTREGFDSLAGQALDELLMVVLERLVRVYGRENLGKIFDPMVPVDRGLVAQLMMETLPRELDLVSDRLGSDPFAHRIGGGPGIGPPDPRLGPGGVPAVSAPARRSVPVRSLTVGSAGR